MYKKLLFIVCAFAAGNMAGETTNDCSHMFRQSTQFPGGRCLTLEESRLRDRWKIGEFPPIIVHNTKELNRTTAQHKNLVVAITTGTLTPGRYIQGGKPCRLGYLHHNDIEIPNAKHALIYEAYVMNHAKESEKGWMKKLFGKTPFNALLKALKVNLSHLRKHDGYAYAFYKNGTCIRRHYGYLSDKELLTITAKLF